MCTGDLNVHVDVAQDKQSKELIAVLEMFGLFQHVTEPTHSRGHTLDVLISKGVFISNVDAVDVALSDDFSLTSLLHPNQQLGLQLFREE